VTTQSCEEYQLKLEDFIAGELETAEANSVRSHLASCTGCREFQSLLERENEAYANFFTQTSLEPSTEMWSRISTRIVRQDSGSSEGSRTVLDGRERAGFFDWLRLPSFARQFAAAAALVLVTVFITWLVISRSSQPNDASRIALNSTPTPQPTVQETPQPGPTALPKAQETPVMPSSSGSGARMVAKAKSSVSRPVIPVGQLSETEQIKAQIARTEGEYLKAIRLLDRAIVKRSDTLDAATMAQYQSSLLLIDDSIDKSRAALRRQPGDLAAGQFLMAAYARKVDLMQEIAIK